MRSPPQMVKEKKETEVPAIPIKEPPNGNGKPAPNAASEAVAELDASPKPQVEEVAKSEPAPPKKQIKESPRPPEILSPAPNRRFPSMSRSKPSPLLERENRIPTHRK